MSDTSLDGTILSLRARIAQRERLTRRLEGAQRQLTDARAKLDDAERDLEAESGDVAKLEGLSLRSLFYTVLSSRQEQLDEERQDVLRAELIRDERRTAVRRLTEEVDSIEAELNAVGELDSEQASALAAKEEQIRQSGSAAATELREIDERIATRRAEADEIAEARAAGERASSSLASVVESLGSAGSWGTWDLLGGGLLSTAIKHSHIDTAKSRALEAQADLRSFERELADTSTSASYEIQLDGIETFADYFLDGLIFDWIVQSKINRSREAAVEVGASVDEALAQLDGRARLVEAELEALAERRRAVIER